MGNCASKDKRKGALADKSNPPTGAGTQHGLTNHPSDQKESNTSSTQAGTSSELSNINHMDNGHGQSLNKIFPTPAHELKWKYLHSNYVPKIIDPADVHCVLDECLRDTIQKLHSAEMTLLSRRVRKVVRKLFNSDSNHVGNSTHANSQAPSSSSSPALSTKTNKKKLKKASKLSNGIIDTSIPLHQLSPAQAETRSKQIYQKDYVLDEYLMRQIFMGGNQILYLGLEGDWTKQSLDMYLQRQSHGKSNRNGNGNLVNEGATTGLTGSVRSYDTSIVSESISGISVISTTTTTSASEAGNKNNSTHRRIIQTIDELNTKDQNLQQGSGMSSPSRRKGRRRNYHDRNEQANNNTQPLKSNGHSSSSSVGDIFGNAYQLLLYLSEERWDHVADIARLSAENADLILDVNEQTRKMLHLKYQQKEAKVNGGKKSSSFASSSIPLPPHECPTEENYNLLIPPPLVSNGVTLQEVSFLVASALRGSRNKRLVLLFYLLLKKETLVEILENHPCGGVPTWLLEADNDWILSYASLSHYFYYGGMPPSNNDDSRNSSNGSGRGTGNGQTSNNMKSFFSSSPPPQASNKNNVEVGYSTSLNDVKVDALCAIETMAVLLHHIPREPSDNIEFNEKATAASKSHLRKGGLSSKPNRERVVSYSDKKFHAANMHLMLTDYLRKLQQNPHEAPSFENDAEQFRKLEMIDNFWDVSKSIYSRCKNAGAVGDMALSWTMGDFINWAEHAIPDDTCLDHIMHQLFGLGLLPAPAMERKLVCESWVDWQLKESRFLEFPHDENYDSFSVMTLGIKNLLLFSSSKDSGDNMEASTNDDEFFSMSGDESPIWGGIGGFDGRGGLGYGLMYCIDKKWWDHWKSYVGWEWSNGHSDTIFRDRPYGSITENLIDHSTNIAGRGTLGSYELMKRELKKDIDYVLVPPRVWDILYEMYGGGPPLPRMIMKIPNSVAGNSSIDVTSHEQLTERPMKVPKALNVLTHPWILECRVSFDFCPENYVFLSILM